MRSRRAERGARGAIGQGISDRRLIQYESWGEDEFFAPLNDQPHLRIHLRHA
jgi:hypothetical protein